MSVSYMSRVFELEKQLVLSLCENIDSPRALTVALLVKNNEWQQLIDLEIRWENYLVWSDFSDDYLVTSILSKNPRLPLEVDRRAVAISKFLAAEERCKETNTRLLRYQDGQVMPDPDVHRVIHYAREYIRDILGPLTRNDLRYCEEHMGFGPGATTSVSGVVTQGKKYSPRVLDATPRVVDFGLFCLPPGWRQHVSGFNPRNSSKLTTVPKSAKTDRVICIEPDLNIFVQKGVGALLRRKLAAYGLDLSTQENNQNLARIASSHGYCTIDLSAASDTVSRELIWTLLPERWCQLLHFCRVDETSYDGKTVVLEKWSSMGNGYTFELETLLFYAVLLAVRRVASCEGEVLAYGDDLIIADSGKELTLRALNFLGFSANREKTFGTGRFHESCGTDWFDGHNVRPFFLRSDHHDFQTVCYIYANGLRRWAYHRNSGKSCDRRVLPAWLRCFNAVGQSDRHRTPEGFGDVGFSVDFDRACPTVERRSRTDRRQISVKSPLSADLVTSSSDIIGGVVVVEENDPRLHPYGWGGYTFSFRHIGSRQRRISEQGCLTAFLNGNSTDFTKARESLRGRYLPATTRLGHVLTWPNLGPWQ